MRTEIGRASCRSICNQEFTVSEIRLAIKDGIPSSMQDELEDHQEEYRFLTYEDCCELLSTIDVKDKRKRAANQIKKIASARAASISDSDDSVRITIKNKSRTGILSSNKGPQKKVHKHHGTQRHCVLARRQ